MTRDGFQLEKTGGSADCIERDLTFPSTGFAMPGTLCVPRKMAGPFPVVVLVQGSGSHDRDETIGPNKPFRDIAWGLAAQGVATLRFDKRGFAFKREFASQKITLEAEVLADAVAAVEFASTRKEVDPKQVFLLGHGLGGQVAPLIAARAPGAAGVILLAAAARPLDELIMEETEFQAKLAGLSEDAPQLQQLRDAIAKLRSGQLSDTETLLGAPVSYWREFRSLNELDTLKKLTVPVLVLQGGKDIQVRRTDYDILMKTLANKPPALREGHFYPNLNHLFQVVEGQPTGAEYDKPSPVAREVIDTIAEWVKKPKQ